MSAEPEWFLAVCQDCEPILPQPFRDQDERNEWATQHARSTQHRVLLATDGDARRG